MVGKFPMVTKSIYLKKNPGSATGVLSQTVCYCCKSRNKLIHCVVTTTTETSVSHSSPHGVSTYF